MSYDEPYEEHYDRHDTELSGGSGARWPLDWHGLYPRERCLWFEQLWADVCTLRDRYRLPLRCGWWEHQLQVEALAALAGWVARYDSSEWDDPPGKLMLLYDLERISPLLREGDGPFCRRRDREAFLRHLRDIGCEPPPRQHPARPWERKVG